MNNEGQTLTPEKSLDLLKTGNSEKLKIIKKTIDDPAAGKDYKEFRERLTKGQHPFAIIVSCSDSRFPPEEIFQKREGELFVVRTAGHVVGDDAAGSIEYAVEHLKVPLIVVLGHDKCGAVTAAVKKSEERGHICNVLEHINPAVEMIGDAGGDRVSLAIDQHIKNTVQYLQNLDPFCSKYHQEGKIKIIGARCSIDTYEVEWIV